MYLKREKMFGFFFNPSKYLHIFLRMWGSLFIGTCIVELLLCDFESWQFAEVISKEKNILPNKLIGCFLNCYLPKGSQRSLLQTDF